MLALIYEIELIKFDTRVDCPLVSYTENLRFIHVHDIVCKIQLILDSSSSFLWVNW